MHDAPRESFAKEVCVSRSVPADGELLLSKNIASTMQVARFATESFTSSTISLLLRRSVHSFLPGGSLSLQTGPAAAERSSFSEINGRSEEHSRRQLKEGDLLSSGGGEGGGDRQLCGRGDKKTKKGKRFKGTFGNCRHRKNWNTERLREKWEIPAVPPPGSLLIPPFPPLLTRY